MDDTKWSSDYMLGQSSYSKGCPIAEEVSYRNFMKFSKIRTKTCTLERTSLCKPPAWGKTDQKAALQKKT